MKSALRTVSMGFVALMAVPVLAADDGQFAQHKQESLSHIEQRLADLQGHKSCVSAAQDGAALKKCHEAMRDSMKEKKREFLEKRRDKIDGHLKKMEEKK